MSLPLRLTRKQLRVLGDLAGGGCFFAALHTSSDYLQNDVLFSEKLGIVVHAASGHPEDRYRVRNKTVAPLYLATPPLVIHDPGGGWRAYHITDAGRAAWEANR